MKIKNFNTLNYFEKLKIFHWRNDRRVSKWMITKKIFFKNHLNFITSLKQERNKKYFLISQIGIFYFNIVSNYLEIGLYKNPNKKRVGNILLKEALNYAKKHYPNKKIILYVYKYNKKAINLYKKFGFKIVDKHKNLLKMELSKNGKLRMENGK